MWSSFADIESVFHRARSHKARPSCCSIASLKGTRRMDNDCVTTKRFICNRDGQALVEYTLVVLLVTFLFWLGIRDTDVRQGLQTAWTSVSGSIGPTPTTDPGSSAATGASGGGSSGGSSSTSGTAAGGNSDGSVASGSGGGAAGGSAGGAGAGNS